MRNSVGEVHQVKPEYTTMSRNKGIGSAWFSRFASDVFPSDEVIVNGKQTRPPRYYDSQYELTNPDELGIIKASRRANARPHRRNNTPERLRVRETIQDLKTKRLKRSL